MASASASVRAARRCWRSGSFFRSAAISRAFHTLISLLRTSRSRTSSNIDSGTPAAVTTLRACNVMWPFWMPSVASARSAAKFCASPTAAMTWASCVADSTPSRRMFSAAVGLDSRGPPTVPTLIGTSMPPHRLPSLSDHHFVSDE